MSHQNRHRFRRTALALTLALAGAAATTAVGTGTASATSPGHTGACHFDWTNYSGEAVCPEANSFRVVLVCVHAGAAYNVYGPWVDRYNISSADCNLGDMLQNIQPLYQSVYADVDA